MTNVAITPNCEQAVLHVSSFVFTLQSTTDCDIWHGTLAVHWGVTLYFLIQLCCEVCISHGDFVLCYLVLLCTLQYVMLLYFAHSSSAVWKETSFCICFRFCIDCEMQQSSCLAVLLLMLMLLLLMFVHPVNPRLVGQRIIRWVYPLESKWLLSDRLPEFGLLVVWHDCLWFAVQLVEGWRVACTWAAAASYLASKRQLHLSHQWFCFFDK